MSLKVFRSGLWKTVADTNVFRVRVGGVWKDVNKVRVWATHGTTTGWREVWVKASPTPTPTPPPDPTPPTPPTPTITVAKNPPSVSGTRTTPGTVTTTSVTVTPSGGTAPYTYQWLLQSYDQPSAPIAVNPTNPTTAFRQSMANYDDSGYGDFKCIVTDSLGFTGSTTVRANFYVTHPPGAPAP